MDKVGAGRTPESDAKVAAGVVLTLLLPAVFTLRAVNVPQSVVPLADDPTPLGYTRSLSLFAVPSVALAWWFLRHPDYQFQRKAFGITLALLVPAGFALDLLRASAFFTFPNRAATLGIAVPVVGGTVPLEEFFFYVLGFLTTLLLYVWCDEYWLGAYKVPDYTAQTRDLRRVVHFHVPSLVVGVALFVAAVVCKRFFSGTPGVLPGYFLFLLLTALLPSVLLFPTARAFINWRALSFTFFLMLLVSLLWEATLAVPYQWWGYQESQMLGITIGAWCRLPVEAALLWMVVSYTTVIVYEVAKVVLACGRPWRHALFGKPGGATAAPPP